MACAVFAAAALGGCSTTGGASTVTVSGSTLTIYASAPASADSRAQDVLAAEELAFTQGRTAITRFKLQLKVVRSAKPSDDARTAIKDSSTVGYLGEIIPGQSSASMGILEDQDVLQVSPTDNAVELTQGSPAVPGPPKSYYESYSTYGRTFARVVPNSALEAKALVSEAQRENVTKLFVTSDGSAYGAALAYAVRHAAAGAGVSFAAGAPTVSAFSSSGADGLLFASADPAVASRLFNAVAQASGSAKLFAASGLSTQQFVASLSSAASGAVRISTPGFLPADLPAAGQQFVTSFQAAYHHSPAPEAIFGYEAMKALLSVIERAGANASNRTTIQRDFFAIRNRASALGTYSIDARGDTDIAPFVISRVRAGQLTPCRFVSEQG
jgi:branched-chain amino acid transport system substrate-binding protein